MCLVDTSVWVDYLRGDATPQVRALKDLLSGDEIVGIAPIINALAPHGNPSTENLFGVVSVLQKKTRMKLRVTEKAA